MLRVIPPLTLILLLGPVFAGFIGTLFPALGYFPAIGADHFNLEAFQALWTWPGLWDAARLSISTGLAATALSLVITVALTAAFSHTKGFHYIQRLLSPLLSIPHAAAAFGFAFLIAPSGWIARLLSPWLTGWERPLDLLITQDPWGITLTLGLMSKEIPFLLFMTLAALPQLPTRQARQTAQALGYSPLTGWIKTIFPALYRQIKLPVYVVLAYSMTVVDVAIILGPNTPAPLAVQIVKWMSSPDLALRLQASAAALMQTGLVVLALTLWLSTEKFGASCMKKATFSGRRKTADTWFTHASLIISITLGASLFLGLTILTLWSFSGFWSFPNALPDTFTLRNWIRHSDGISDALWQTFYIAIIATAIAIALTLSCLENEHRQNKRLAISSTLLLYLPLLIPQIAFLPGLQTLLLTLGAQSGVFPVICAHLIFVLPYVYLSLADPFRAWEPRYATIAALMGVSENRIFWQIRLPMLLRAVLSAIAIGLSVSIGQYLATLLIGGGRVSTLTTEAVALASGADRRAIGAYALLQTAAALTPFALALFIPRVVWRNRKGLSHA